MALNKVGEWKRSVSKSPLSIFACPFTLILVYFSSAMSWPELNTSFQIVIVWPSLALFYFSILMKVLNACWVFNMKCWFLWPFLNSSWCFVFKGLAFGRNFWYLLYQHYWDLESKRNAFWSTTNVWGYEKCCIFLKKHFLYMETVVQFSSWRKMCLGDICILHFCGFPG